MITTFQFKNQSVLDHGISVHKHYKQIIKALDEKDYSLYHFPTNLIENWDTFKALLSPIKKMKMYHIYHDCGKPFCRTVDENGKQHFPNHSEVSAKIFRECFGDFEIEAFIRKDMLYHAGTMEDIENAAMAFSKEFMFSLWLTSFAELYSNKEQFDSTNQLSFHIKYKKLSKAFKRIMSSYCPMGNIVAPLVAELM